MKPHRLSTLASTSLALVLLGLAAATAARAQAPSPVVATCPQITPAAKPAPSSRNRSGIKLTVKDGKGQAVARKRFYLLEGDKPLGEMGLDWTTVPKRASFLKGASPELLALLDKHDCDSLYCPELEAEFPKAKDTVPELKRAYEEGLRKYKSEKLALRWLTVNFPLKNARTGYYNLKRDWLEKALLQVAGGDKEKANRIVSVMTDEKGVAYFTGLKLVTFHVTNLIPLEDGNLLWDCAVTVPQPDPKRLYSVAVEFDARKAAPASTASAKE